MTFRFTLIAAGVSTFVDEPVGWTDIELTLRRDEQWHGIYFEFGSKALTFKGTAADIIRSAYLDESLAAEVKLIVEGLCDNEWIVLIDGRLNFGKLKFQCDEGCTVNIPVEQDSCMMKLRARWETPIDLNSAVAIDGDALTTYPKMKQTIEIPPGGIALANEAYVETGGDTHDIPGSPHIGSGIGGTATLAVRPWYDRVQEQSLLGQLSNPLNEWVFGATDAQPMSPQALIDNEIHCFHDNVNYSVRMKGSITLKNLGGSSINRIVGVGIYRTGWGTDRVLMDSVIVSPLAASPAGDETINFDETFTGSFSPVPVPFTAEHSNPFFAVIEVGVTWASINMDFAWHFDEETYVKVDTVETCEPTDAVVYNIHENMSRVVESATGNCMKVYSNQYGRTDAMPYSSPVDGCGGLRAITNGKELRQDAEATMKISPKTFFEGLNKIDCIGMGMETHLGDTVLRVEDFAHFYQDVEIMRLDAVSGVVKEVIEGKFYNTIHIGYNKWDTETLSCARNEYNSQRTYSTEWNSIKNTIEILSELIAGYYALEKARKASIAGSEEFGSTQFDTDFFIICLERSGIDFIVEQGNITGATNITSPALAINYRLTPVRNLIRWWRILAAGYRNIFEGILEFRDGVGNVLANALLSTGPCIPETHALGENEDIVRTDIADPYGLPLWTNEKVSFEYPFSLRQYIELKENPNGYVSYQCGNGDFEKGWLTELKFTPADGKATFILLAKRQ